MKRLSVCSIVLVSLAISLMAGRLDAQEKGAAMWGTTVIPSFSGPGLGVRSWLTPKYGFGAEVQPSWDFTDWILRGRYMYTLTTTEKARWFALATVGYMSINESDEISGVEFDFSVSFLTLSFGAGFERLFGFKKNKGWGLEAGFQTGKGDYESKITIPVFGEITTEGTFKVFPIYFGGNLSFYFK